MDFTTLSANFGQIPVVSCGSQLPLVDINLADSLFRTHGVVIFVDTGADVEQFRVFAGRFGANTGVREVFVGRRELGWHAEYAYLPMRPGIVWFYCVRPALIGGETRVVDGVKLALHMRRDTKHLLQKLPLQFNMRLSREDWQLWIGQRDASEARTYLNRFPGMSTHISSADSLEMQYTTSALYTTQFSSEEAFANTLLHAIDDPEHYGLRMADGSAASLDMLNELNTLAERFALSLEWREHQIVMIDNSRFMHARATYSDSVREVKFLCTYRYQLPGPA
jgi:alpha-ketoglutarate-dependent taurine dioxygenase